MYTPNLIRILRHKKFGVRVALIGQLLSDEIHQLSDEIHQLSDEIHHLTDEIHHLTDETDQLNVKYSK